MLLPFWSMPGFGYRKRRVWAALPGGGTYSSFRCNVQGWRPTATDIWWSFGGTGLMACPVTRATGLLKLMPTFSVPYTRKLYPRRAIRFTGTAPTRTGGYRCYDVSIVRRSFSVQATCSAGTSAWQYTRIYLCLRAKSLLSFSFWL